MSVSENPQGNAENVNQQVGALGSTDTASLHDKLIADSFPMQTASLDGHLPSTFFRANEGLTRDQIMQQANADFPMIAPIGNGPQGLKGNIINQVAPAVIQGRQDIAPNLTGRPDQQGPTRAWRAEYNQVVPQAIPGQQGQRVVEPNGQRVVIQGDQRVVPQAGITGVPNLIGDQRLLAPITASPANRPELRIQNQTGTQEWQLFGSSPTAIGAQYPEAQVQADGERLFVQFGNARIMVQRGAGADVQVGQQQQRLQGQPVHQFTLGNGSEMIRVDVQSGSLARFARTQNGYVMFESIEADGKRIKFEGGEPTQIIHSDGRRDTLSQGRIARTDYQDGRSFEEFDHAGRPVRASRNGVQYEYQNGLPTKVLSPDGRYFQARYDEQGRIAEYHIVRLLNTAGGQQIQRIESGVREQGGVRVTKFDPSTGQGQVMAQLAGDVQLSPTGSMQYLDAQGFRQEANGVRTRRDNRIITALVEGPDGRAIQQQIQPLRSIVYPDGRSTEYMYLSQTGARINGMVPGQGSPDAVFSYARRNAQGQIEEVGIRMPELPGQPPQWLEFRANRVQGKTAFTPEEVQRIGQLSQLLVPGDPQQTMSNLAALRANPQMREFLPANQAEVTMGIHIDQATGKQIHVYANRDYRVLDENGGEHHFTANGVVSRAADGRRFHYDYTTGNTTYLQGNQLQVVAWDSSRDVPGDKQVVLDVSNAQRPNMTRFGSRFNAQQVEFTYDTSGNVTRFTLRQPVVQGDQVSGWNSQTYVRQEGNNWKIEETGEIRELSVQRNERGNVSISGYKEVDGQRIEVNRTFQADGSELVGTGSGDQFQPLYQLKAPPPPIAHGPARFPSNVPPPDYMMERARAMHEAQSPRGPVYRRGPGDNRRRPYEQGPSAEEETPGPRARMTQDDRRPPQQVQREEPRPDQPPQQTAEEPTQQNRRRRRMAQDQRNQRRRVPPAAVQDNEPVSTEIR